MKLSLSILSTALCLSGIQATNTDCLDAMRYNLESLCRAECAKEEAVAFSVSYDEHNDSCRCYENIGTLGSYTGSGDRDSRRTCYSMVQGEKTKVLDYGDCIVDRSIGSLSPPTTITMEKCEGDEMHEGCVDKNHNNIENVCHKECTKHEAVAFAVNYSEMGDNDCRCYPALAKGGYTGSGDVETHLTCFSMEGKNLKVLDYGDCVPSGMNGPYFNEHTMKRCPQVEKLLRGAVSV